MSAPYLLTGVTGGLGAKILHDMLHVHKIAPSSIIATSRSESNRAKFERQGVHFRVLDYARPETIRDALKGVGLFLFMSSSERDTPKRNWEQDNVVDATIEAGVETWYVSLAFGGYGDISKVGFMQAHLHTEERLVKSGLKFLSIRAGVYIDAFPLYLNWYPTSTSVLLPKTDPPVSEGMIAFTSRDELGEGIAALVTKGIDAFPSIKPKTRKNIILLTSEEAQNLQSIVEALGQARGKSLPIEYLEPQQWIEASAKDDQGGKPLAWFEARLVVLEGMNNGDGAIVDPALATLLGRRPENGIEGVARLIKVEPDFTWHQNHMSK